MKAGWDTALFSFLTFGMAALFVAALMLVILLVRRRPLSPPAHELSEVREKVLLLEKAVDRLEGTLREELGRGRAEAEQSAKLAREELTQAIIQLGRSTAATLGDQAAQQKHLLDGVSKQLIALTAMNEEKLERIRRTVEEKLGRLQEENAKKLEEMRRTVDEKLHDTLEKRLGESFRLVSERLELVHKGLGEMQALASGVGDLKKVLANVKTRGTLGEIQLENLLEQILTSDQYARQVPVGRGAERVDFAIRLPGKADDEAVWLPIDSKFPLDDYHRLIEAQEAGDIQAVHEAARLLEARVRNEAKAIQAKYIHPPETTDFAILFLPTEGLFAEVLRRPGLWESLQRDHRVVVTGPTTITALLNSLHMGFRTLAIEKRSSEVWRLLGAVKTEFGKFAEILEKTQKKLQEASNTIESASRKTRTIERRLRSVESLPEGDVQRLLGQEIEEVGE